MTHLPVATIQYSNGTVVNIFGPQQGLASGTTRGLSTGMRRRTTSGRARGGVSAIQGTVTQGAIAAPKRRRRARRRARTQNVAQQLT